MNADPDSGGPNSGRPDSVDLSPDLILSSGPADAARLATLHAGAFDAPWDTAAFEVLLSQPGVFAVRSADGFILCRTVLDEAEILTLAVRSSARRAGLGARLTRAAAALAAREGATRLFLEVAEDNAAARALYVRTGFEQTGRRPRYYARPGGEAVDALLLTLNFDAPLPTA